MPTFLISSLRGGMNNSDPPIAVADDQCVDATNVEYVRSMLGERRRGAASITLGGDLGSQSDVIYWVYRHLPDGDERNAQFWAWGTDLALDYLAYKDTTWHNVTVPDALDKTSGYPYQIEAASLHGKLFIFYKSAVDCCHVFDPDISTTSLRRVGMAALSTAPTAADSGGAGTLTTTRYYRVRETVQVSGVTKLRSEPSDALAFTPDGAHASITVTKPATVNSDPAATHWELEASTDDANFYVIATTAIGTATATDANTASQITTNFELSATIGDYTRPPSYKFGVADEDRLVFLSRYEDQQGTAEVAWTPVRNAEGVGNDERIPLDPTSTVNLEGLTGGGIRDVSRAVAGELWVGKYEHLYKLNRTGRLSQAYEAQLVTSGRGTLRGSMVEIVDPEGNPAVFFCDPAVGPCLMGRRGIQRCGQDIWETWKLVQLNGYVVTRTLYYPEANQIHLWVSVSTTESTRGASFTNAVTNTRLVLQVNEMRFSDEGWRRGWTIWDGASAAVRSVCLFSENIDSNTTRSIILRPFLAVSDPEVWRTDTGDDDNGTAYSASVTTKPYTPTQLQTDFEVKSATLVAKAETDAALTISIIPNGGVTTTKLGEDIDLSPDGDETFVIRRKDELGIAELTTMQLQFADVETPVARWELARCTLTISGGQEA